ncbi:hypothetical protein [Mastigocoleus sp. MO_188.B34]|uniref:hypothetical protein n=1 Tax=Mastigocoleus sp. MO_188.B34 TaxID=3036635 RepID=UPI00261C5EC6|nr:hypothetical protein [Mastigocoleus sp. MO_188.B34]MDJ0695549.1 hypothetical protein [Mastigocoleus sp. MO_188.B34]
MLDISSIRLTVSFIDPELDEEDKDQETQNLLRQMRELDEIENVERLVDFYIPDNSKSITAKALAGATAIVKSENTKKVWSFLTERLNRKQIEMSLEAADGRKINLKVRNQEEFKLVMQEAQEFIKV